MASVWFRKTVDDEWCLASPLWQSISESRAHRISDRMNEKHSHGMWWVSDCIPGKDKTVE